MTCCSDTYTELLLYSRWRFLSFNTASSDTCMQDSTFSPNTPLFHPFTRKMQLSFNCSSSQHRKKPTFLLLHPCKCRLQMPLLARAQGWHGLVLILLLQPGEARDRDSTIPTTWTLCPVCTCLPSLGSLLLLFSLSDWQSASPSVWKHHIYCQKNTFPALKPVQRLKFFNIKPLSTSSSSCQQLSWPCTKELLWLQWPQHHNVLSSCSPEGAPGFWGTLCRCAWISLCWI